MMRRHSSNAFWIPLTSCACLTALTAGCQQQMANQPSYRPLEPSSFFSDGRSARPLAAGTVPRGHLRTDTHLYTGRIPGRATSDENQKPQAEGRNNPTELKVEAFERSQFVDTFPFPITAQILNHGHDRFTIYCAVCHDPLGAGRGKIVERGFTAPKTYHSDRLRQAPVGYFFAVISEGYGSMPSYAEQISARDRWAIVAYIRALQLSQHYPLAELSPEMRAELEQSRGGEEAP